MKNLTSEVRGPEGSPVMVLFGGNPLRRHEVLESIRGIGGITAIGALSEEEGMSLLATLPRVDLVLIGGRYSNEQRKRIREHVRSKMASTQITEPGVDYPYDNAMIEADIRARLGRARQ
ncbi:MAG: hypothetical protein JNK05_25170 [Myxococcales bacterium]|nr:hypothetical protein [Myxococcales bacterium]